MTYKKEIEENTIYLSFFFIETKMWHVFKIYINIFIYIEKEGGVVFFYLLFFFFKKKEKEKKVLFSFNGKRDVVISEVSCSEVEFLLGG